jgi:hypothetical protein
MANVKFSELPQVVTVTGTDIVPTVANATTSKITIKDFANAFPQVTSSISSSNALSASNAATSSYPIAVSGSTLYSTNPKSTIPSGTSLVHSIFLGSNAGRDTTAATFSTFIGNGAGQFAYSAESSNFLGQGAGFNADGASYSNFIGRSAGEYQSNASYTILLGYRAGFSNGDSLLGSNNIIIGNNITLSEGVKNAINLGSIIFGTGSYSTPTGTAFSGSAMGKVGINQPNPSYTLDVSGSLRIEKSTAILTEVSISLNFADDTAAAAGGVPLGGLYRNGNFVVIRIS